MLSLTGHGRFKIQYSNAVMGIETPPDKGFFGHRIEQSVKLFGNHTWPYFKARILMVPILYPQVKTPIQDSKCRLTGIKIPPGFKVQDLSRRD
jgi:hypothetical protein